MKAEVLPGAERPAHAGQGHPDPVGVQPEAVGHLVAVRVEPLGGDEQVHPAVIGRNCQPRLRAEEGLVLHAHLIGALHGDQAVAPGGRRVAVAQVDPTDEVAVRMNGCRRLGRRRVDERLGDLVFHDDGVQRPTDCLGMVGSHYGHRFTLVPHLVAGQHRLVAVLEAEGGHSGHVGVRQHGVDPGGGYRPSDVDRRDPGRWMGRPQGATPEHPVVPEVAGEREVTGHLGDPVRTGRALADAGSPGPLADRRGRHSAHATASRRMAAARSTASRIRP